MVVRLLIFTSTARVPPHRPAKPLILFERGAFMPPKGSQLLNRVLARENDDGGSRSSGSEKDMDFGLTHLAATASAGLRMEMETLRESRAREKVDGIDRDACIVDRHQFFNTQIGVGYQHKKVFRQRTVDSSDVGQQVVDMSVASKSHSSKGGKRRQLDKDGNEDDLSDMDVKGKSKRKKSEKSASKTKSKKRKKNQYSGKKDKKAKKDSREKKSSHRRKTSSRDRDRDSKKKDDTNTTQERKRKKKRKRDGAREERDGSTKGAGIRGNKSDGSSSSSSAISSNSMGESDDSLEIPTVSNVASSTPPASGKKRETDLSEDTMKRARLPLQRLRDLIEEKIQKKTRAKASDGNQRKIIP